MKRLSAAALGATALALLVSTTLAIGQQKPAKGGRRGQTATPAALATGAGNAAGNPVYLTIRDLMQSIVDPSADVLWGAVGSVADKDGLRDLIPQTEDEWLDVRRAAVRMVEGGNLLMMPGREAAPPGSKSEAEGVELEPAQITALVKKNRTSFNAFAKSLQEVAMDALRASEAKNTASLLDIGERMENVCEGCHQTFWYPLEK